MAEQRYRILVSHREVLYKFATFLLSHSDGSFYFHLVRKGKSASYWIYGLDLGAAAVEDLTEVEEARRKGIDISYHSSGLIHYKNTSNEKIAGEPLHHVTQHFCFAKYSIPAIYKLDVHQKALTDSDFVITLPPNLTGRIQFSVCVSPLHEPQIVRAEYGVNILFPQLFSVNVVLDRECLPVPKKLSESFVFVTPRQGLFHSQPMNKDFALTEFHKKLTGSKGIIVYAPNDKGLYRVVFSVPMRIPPKIDIEFMVSGFTVDIVEKTKAHALFRVLNKHGHLVKDLIGIKGIELNSEL